MTALTALLLTASPFVLIAMWSLGWDAAMRAMRRPQLQQSAAELGMAHARRYGTQIGVSQAIAQRRIK